MLQLMLKVNGSSVPGRARVVASALPLVRLLAGICFVAGAQTQTSATSDTAKLGGTVLATSFDAAADAALLAMRRRAVELNIGGVAVVAYFEGDKIQDWTSKMAVVGRMKDEPTSASKGSNLLAIAYAKAAEMADTLKDSGSQVRPPLTGEFGWSGGVIVHGRRGYLIAAFSGGQSEDDVKVSRAGVEVMRTKL